MLKNYLPGIILTLAAIAVYRIAASDTVQDLEAQLRAKLLKKWEDTTPEDWIAAAHLRDRIKALNRKGVFI